jgi:hypothetical protein
MSPIEALFLTNLDFQFIMARRWVHHGEQNVAFRVASWKDQRADQHGSHIAVGHDSKFTAFVTNKSITNRRDFAEKLRRAAASHDQGPSLFLRDIYDIICQMHSPCMRLELLQYIFFLDNRFSVSLIKESIELAATCMSISKLGS